MFSLPSWKKELYIEISQCFPLGRDYQPASINRFYSDTLENIARSCIDLEGEFFFMASPLTGCVGSLPRENFFRFSSDNVFNLGFLFVLGYSGLLERAVILSLSSEAAKGLSAGVTSCSLWSSGKFRTNTNVIAVTSDDPFYDCSEYLKIFERMLRDIKELLKVPELSYYAEKFGYDRFPVTWENEKPYDAKINQTLSELKNEGTREIVGGSASIDFPSFMGISVAVKLK